MYRITYGQYILYDPRGANEIDNLVVLDPVIPLTVTGSGVAEFTLLPTHPHLDKIRKLRGIVEVLENDDVIYRGRVVGNTKNFDLSHRISVEGITSCLNDSIIEPYNFPGDFVDDPEYQAAAESGNVVDYYFRWLLGQHNNQVSDEQKILPGNVTVTDPNNYITRSKENPEVVADLVKALPESSLGGYLMVRYEADGTYLDYVADLPLTNAQPVEFGQNLLDLIAEYDATETCTAVRPVGKDGLDISLEQDGDVDDDIVKSGNIVYSKSGRQTYGKITKLVQFSDTTVAKNLVSSAATWLRLNGLGENETITCTAVDLHLVDSDVASLRVGRHTLVSSLPHGFENQFPLLEMSLDIINPQNTSITMGRTRRTFTGEQIGADANINIKLDEVKNNVSGQIGNVTTEIKHITEAQQNSERIILSALEKKVETSDFETYQQEQKSELEILSNQINITVTETEQKIKDAVDGIDSVTTSTGYTFGADGLRIAKQGEQMENKLDNTGMYVTRDNVPILTANNQGVTALNLTAHQYLIVGQNSRFEDYTGDGGEARTGCFWIGGV